MNAVQVFGALALVVILLVLATSMFAMAALSTGGRWVTFLIGLAFFAGAIVLAVFTFTHIDIEVHAT